MTDQPDIESLIAAAKMAIAMGIDPPCVHVIEPTERPQMALRAIAESKKSYTVTIDNPVEATKLLATGDLVVLTRVSINYRQRVLCRVTSWAHPAMLVVEAI